MQNQKDVILEDIILTPFGSGSFSIRSMVVSFGIYENIYKNFLEGDIELVDGIDLIDSIPIVGKEQIEFKFRTPTSEKVRSIKMIVNSIKDRVNSNDNKANVIMLSLISLSSYQNSINKVSESIQICFSFFDSYGKNFMCYKACYTKGLQKSKCKLWIHFL